MPRTARSVVGNICYHVINRANNGLPVFRDAEDYARFQALLEHANKKFPMRLLAYCLMPNHFHFCVQPRGDEDLSAWMAWLMNSHVRKHHARYHTNGRIWQGRFKAFAIQEDHHLLTVMRYIERNPLRAGLVRLAADWPYCSLRCGVSIDPSPVERPRDWLTWVQEAQTLGEIEAVRRCSRRGAPFGEDGWVQQTAQRLGVESSLRRIGRPTGGVRGALPT